MESAVIIPQDHVAPMWAVIPDAWGLLYIPREQQPNDELFWGQYRADAHTRAAEKYFEKQDYERWVRRRAWTTRISEHRAVVMHRDFMCGDDYNTLARKYKIPRKQVEQTLRREHGRL